MRLAGIISCILIAGCLGLSAYAWFALPVDAQIAVHFSADGSVNRTAGKLEGLLLIPLLLASVSVLLGLLPNHTPKRQGLEQSRIAYTTSWIGGIGVGALAHLALVGGALGLDVGQGWVLAGSAVMVMALGNVITTSRPNWLVGIRTPWSLSSEEAWAASNRVAGWGLVLSGLLTLAALVWGGMGWALPVFVGCLLSSALIGAGVSYLRWRQDPEAAR